MPYPLNRMPGCSVIHVTSFEKLKPLGHNPKNSIPNKTATDRPTKHFKEIFFWYFEKFKSSLGDPKIQKFCRSNFMKKKLAENTEEFDRRFDDGEDAHDLIDRGKPR